MHAFDIVPIAFPDMPAEQVPDPFADVDLLALRPPAAALFDAAREIEVKAVDLFRNRRKSPRRIAAMAVAVRPVDAAGLPVGPAFQAVLGDVSAGGLRLLHSRHVKADYLAVRLPQGASSARTMVVRVTRATASGLYYDYGGPFVARPEGPIER